MARAALKSVSDSVASSSERSPARATLAAAIEQDRTLKHEIAEAEDAIRGARRQYDDAITAFGRAERALERASPRTESGPQPRFHSQEDWEAYDQEQRLPPVPIGEARANVDAARDEKDTAKRSLQFHEDRLSTLTGRLRSRSIAIEDAVAAAVKADPALSSLVVEAIRRAKDYHDAVAAFDVLSDLNALDASVSGWDRRPARSDATAWPVSVAWREALEQLCTDPDAPLPA